MSRQVRRVLTADHSTIHDITLLRGAPGARARLAGGPRHGTAPAGRAPARPVSQVTAVPPLSTGCGPGSRRFRTGTNRVPALSTVAAGRASAANRFPIPGPLRPVWLVLPL